MHIFLIAILVNIVLRWVCLYIVSFYVDMGKTNEELNKNFIFSAAALTYGINTAMLYVNVTVLAALFLKQYL